MNTLSKLATGGMLVAVLATPLAAQAQNLDEDYQKYYNSDAAPHSFDYSRSGYFYGGPKARFENGQPEVGSYDERHELVAISDEERAELKERFQQHKAEMKERFEEFGGTEEFKKGKRFDYKLPYLKDGSENKEEFVQVRKEQKELRAQLEQNDEFGVMDGWKAYTQQMKEGKKQKQMHMKEARKALREEIKGALTNKDIGAAKSAFTSYFAADDGAQQRLDEIKQNARERFMSLFDRFSRT